jgi:hypothetical protein
VRRAGAVDCELMGLFRRLAHGGAKWPLFLYGPAGSGKTCAALALTDLVQTTFYGTPEDLCTIILKGGPRRWAPSKAEIVYRDDRPALVAIPAERLVVLDELGARSKITDLHYSAVKEFLDSRELGHNRVGIYISNLEPDKLVGVYDDRIASRLLCGTWFELAGKDRRMEDE